MYFRAKLSGQVKNKKFVYKVELIKELPNQTFNFGDKELQNDIINGTDNVKIEICEDISVKEYLNRGYISLQRNISGFKDRIEVDIEDFPILNISEIENGKLYKLVQTMWLDDEIFILKEIKEN